MSEQEIFYTMALSRLSYLNLATASQLVERMGSAEAVYEHRADIASVLTDCSPRLVESLRTGWDAPLHHAAAEMEFMTKHGVQALCKSDADYPQRLRECDDAPLVLFYRGSASLNPPRVIDIVGTRRSTPYGHDLTERLMADLRQLCPDVLIVSGLAYGIDICAHRAALANGFDTVGVLAHGLDQLYPPRHRQTAVEMVSHGGLLTEFMTGANADKKNVVRRNRIVAGMSDATVLVESAARGGGLITCRIAQSYNRSVFAFPGAVGAPYSEGCNQLIRDNGAALITSAADLVQALGWQPEDVRPAVIEPSLFPDLSAEERRIVQLLQQHNDVQLNILCVNTNLPIAHVASLLFQLEMKGLVKPMAGGTYHLTTI